MLGEQTGVATLPIIAGQTPLQIARRAEDAGKLGGYDVVIYDTAGRVTVDEELMDEVRDVKAAINPHEVLLVADALTGQDAVNTAKAFDGRIGVTGIVLTRADGDGRGGAALSMRAVTGKPIKLIGVGEKWDALEDFHPGRIASPHSRHGRRRQPRRESRANDRRREGDEDRREDEEGVVRPRRPLRSIAADAEARRHGRRARHVARRRARSKARSTKPASTKASCTSAPSSRR